MEKILTSLDRAVSKALCSRISEPSYRVFRSNNLDYVLCRGIIDSWPCSKDPCYKKLRHLYGDGIYLAVNNVASWDIELSYLVRVTVMESQILKQFKNPVIVDTYTFMSSSHGWTPFGAHIDFEHSIILGVGGGDREIYVWPPGENIGQAKADASSFMGLSFNYEQHLSCAKKIDVKPGSLALIREMEGHVFYAKGAGVFIGLSCIESGEHAGDKKADKFIPCNDSEIQAFIDRSPGISIKVAPNILIGKSKISANEYTIPISEKSNNDCDRFIELLSENLGRNIGTIGNLLESFGGFNASQLVCACLRIGALQIW